MQLIEIVFYQMAFCICMALLFENCVEQCIKFKHQTMQVWASFFFSFSIILFTFLLAFLCVPIEIHQFEMLPPEDGSSLDTAFEAWLAMLTREQHVPDGEEPPTSLSGYFQF